MLELKNNKTEITRMSECIIDFEYPSIENIFPQSRIKIPEEYESKEIRERIKGLFYGSVIGDLYEERKEGEMSSNIQEIMILVDSLIHNGGLFEETDYCKRLQWWNYKGYNGTNKTSERMCNDEITNEVTKEHEYYYHPVTIASNLYNTKHMDSNHCCIKAPFISIINYYNTHEVMENCSRIVSCTHSSYESKLSSMIIALFMSKFLMNESISSTLEVIEEHIISHLEKRKEIEHLNLVNKAFSCDSIESINEWEVNDSIKTLSYVIYVLKNKLTFENGMKIISQMKSIKNVGIIIGALLGCHWKFSSIPKEMLNIPNRELLDKQIDKIIDLLI